MLFSSFDLKTKLNGQDQDRLGQDQDLKKMVLRLRLALRPSSLVTPVGFALLLFLDLQGTATSEKYAAYGIIRFICYQYSLRN